MNRRVIHAVLFLASFGLLAPLVLMATPPRQANPSAQKTSPGGSSSPQADVGERVFAANCSRCHQAPMGLPPRMTGTVIMHMRTRARLSREDEKLLLRFLAP
jgi:cytochrome c5